MLNENQIDLILHDLQAHDWNDLVLQEEVLDHMACLIEGEMQKGKSFSEAYQVAQEEFPAEDFVQLQTKCQEARETSSRRVSFPWFALSTVASVLFFIFFIGDGNAQSYPGIQPIKLEAQVSLPEAGFLGSEGVLFQVRGNSPVLATAQGQVLALQYQGLERGYTLTIQHNNNIQTQYSGLAQAMVKPGEKVQQGQCLGRVLSVQDNVGYLQYQITWEGQVMDPRNFYTDQDWGE